MDRQRILDELQARLDPKPRRNTRMAPKYLDRVPIVRCADGFTMSVQADDFMYCTPCDSVGPWSKVEIGFPSERVEKFIRLGSFGSGCRSGRGSRRIQGNYTERG